VVRVGLIVGKMRVVRSLGLAGPFLCAGASILETDASNKSEVVTG